MLSSKSISFRPYFLSVSIDSMSSPWISSDYASIAIPYVPFVISFGEIRSILSMLFNSCFWACCLFGLGSSVRSAYLGLYFLFLFIIYSVISLFMFSFPIPPSNLLGDYPFYPRSPVPGSCFSLRAESIL